MANSDNMISCGFQGAMGPPDDPSLFVNMLQQKPGPSRHLKLHRTQHPASRNSHTTKYHVPMDEFYLASITLQNSEEEFLSLDGPAIYIVTAGEVEFSARPRPHRKVKRSESEDGAVSGQVGVGMGPL